MSDSRISQLSKDQIIKLISDAETDLETLKNKQLIGPRSLLANLIDTGDEYDAQILHNGVGQVKVLQYRFTADNQQYPLFRMFLTATDTSGNPVAVGFYSGNQLLHTFNQYGSTEDGVAQFFIMLQQDISGTATYRYKVYLIASDTGKLELLNNG